MKYTSSFNYFVSILHFLAEQGIKPHQALSALDMTDFDQNDLQQRIPLSQYSQLLDFSEKTLKQPLFGFYLGQDIKSADFGVLGYLVESSKNLTEAINALLRYDQLVADIGQAHFEQTERLARVSWLPYQACSRQVALRNMTAWVVITRKLLAPNLTAKQINFTDSWSAQERQVLTDWFQCPVICQAENNSIEFPKHYLKLSFHSANPQLFSSLKELSEQQLSSFTQETNFSNRIRSLLISKPLLFNCHIQDIAYSFNLSTRQLQRKLKAEKTSFALLIDQEKQRRASQLLGKKAIGEIAQICGFNEQSSFNKAFARWYQCSPSQYLKRQ